MFISHVAGARVSRWIGIAPRRRHQTASYARRHDEAKHPSVPNPAHNRRAPLGGGNAPRSWADLVSDSPPHPMIVAGARVSVIAKESDQAGGRLLVSGGPRLSLGGCARAWFDPGAGLCLHSPPMLWRLHAARLPVVSRRWQQICQAARWWRW